MLPHASPILLQYVAIYLKTDTGAFALSVILIKTQSKNLAFILFSKQNINVQISVKLS